MTVTNSRSNRDPQAGPTVQGSGEGYFAEIVVLVRWVARTIYELPRALRFPTEILRQFATIVLGSALVVWVVHIAGGVLLGQMGHYLMGQLGAQAYASFFTAAGSLKGIDPPWFGFIVSAKIGCGMVAELGAMRINEEIDAMDTMGVPSFAYLVGTRVWACIVAIPFLFLTAFSMDFLAAYITSVHVFETVSAGGYSFVFWAFTSPVDMFFRSMIWAVVPALLAIIVACYYGYRARGGPVGVGENTSRSMVFNVMLINILGAATMFQLFYGTDVVLPIGN